MVYESKNQKPKTKNEKLKRERYLTTDFGDILATLKPLDLDLEFPSPTQSISLRLPREVLNQIRILAGACGSSLIANNTRPSNSSGNTLTRA